MLENEQLKIEYGLFNKKKVTVPTKQLQAVVERQSYIRRLFGYTAIHFIITSDFENKKSKMMTMIQVVCRYCRLLNETKHIKLSRI